MIRIGISGGIAAGKSLLVRLLRERGFTVHEADRLGHGLLQLPELIASLVASFGDGILESNGSIDRSRLGAIVFADPKARERLNALVFPYLHQMIRQVLSKGQEKVVFLEAALIHDWGIEADFDEVWLVWADDTVRISRIVSRDGLSREEARLRLDAQLPQAVTRKRADRLFENNGSAGLLEAELDKALADLSVRLSTDSGKGHE
jgi:dephospho-CoA kinase